MQQQAHIPVYDWFVTPIETRGIPSFPFFIALLLLIVGGGIFAFMALTPATTTIKVGVEVSGAPIADIPVSLFVDGKLFKTVNSGKNGVAIFQGVPLGKEGKIVVDEEGYTPFEQKFLVGKSTPEITASLQAEGDGPDGKTKVRITLKVTDNNGVPLSGATVSYLDSQSGDYETVVSDASGSAILIADSIDSQLSLTVSKTGYQSATPTIVAAKERTKTISLKKNEDLDDGDIEPDIPRGEVQVTVKDEEGNPVDAVVSLFLASTDALIDSSRTYEAGKAVFGEVDAVGSKVYIVAEPRDSNTLLPYDGSSDPQLLTSKTPLEFSVQLKTKEIGEDYNLTIIVKDKDESPVEDAQVKFYNQETNARLSSQITDMDGIATFSTDSPAYATIYKETFLPAIAIDLIAGEPRNIELVAINEDNSGKLLAIVIDYDGNLVPGAKVNIHTENGFFLGLAEKTTLEDGSAKFSGIPLELFDAEAKYILKASAHGVAGISSSFALAVGEEKEIVIRLDQPKGTAIIRLKDATTQKAVGATGKVAAFLRDDDSEIPDGSCQLLNGTCEIKVPANKNVYFKINANGYLPLTTEDFTVEFEEAKTLESSVIPASLKNELVVTFDGLANPSENAVYSTAIPSLIRGSYYLAKFTLNIPQGSEKGGIFLKVSGSGFGSADEDYAAISGYEKPSDAIITKGITYKPSADCTSDISGDSDSSDSLSKWLNYEYKKQAGTKGIIVKVFVKPEAKSGSSVSFEYRGYAAAGKIFTRVPEDAGLGSEEKNADKDSCYAALNGTTFKVTEDKFSCKGGICMSMLFGKAQAKVAKGFSATTGEPFKAFISGRALKAFDAPYFKISDDDEIIFNAFNFADSSGDASGSAEYTFDVEGFGEGSAVSGDISAKGKLPSAFSKVMLEFGDASGVIHTLKSTVQITGENEFEMGVSPIDLQANEDGRITVILSNALDGEPVSDATVSIEEDESSVFEGNTPESIIGNGNDNSGRDGKYVFKQVHPLSTGTFTIVAKREGFKPSEKQITSRLNDFLESSSDALTLTCDGGSVEITNLLSADIYVLAKSSCLEIMGDGVIANGNQATFSLKGKGTKELVLNPTKQGTFCDLSFDSQAGGAHANLKITTKVNCEVLDKVCLSDAQCKTGDFCDFDAGAVCKKRVPSPSPAPTVSPRPSVPPGEVCTNSNDCDDDEECVSGACQPSTCTNANPCSAGYECVEDKCEKIACSQDNPCDTGYICDPSTKSCIVPECTKDGDCADGKVCRNNYCKVSCTTDEECGGGKFCVANACEAFSQYPDLPENFAIELTEDLEKNDLYYSIAYLVGNSSTYDCEIRSSEPNANLRINNFVEVDCDTYRSTKSIFIKADYNAHPYYTDTVAYVANNTQVSVGLNKTQLQTGRVLITISGAATETVQAKVIGPKKSLSGSSNTVLITDLGFEPASIRIDANSTLTWINMDGKYHGVASFATGDDKLISSKLLFSKDVIKPGQSYSFKFGQPGVYNYRDPTRTSVRGVVIVGDPEAACRYKNLNYFAQRFVGYLAKSTVSFFDPSSGKSAQIAYSSAYKIQVGPNMMQFGRVPGGLAPQGVYGGGFNPTQSQFNINDQRTSGYYQQFNQQYGMGGTFSGAQDPNLCKDNGGGYTCEVHLSPFLPVNGIAFTLVNDYALYSGSPTQLLINKAGTKDEYLSAIYVDKQGPDGFIVGGLQALSEVFLTAPRFATFVLTNDPKKMKYDLDENGNVRLRFGGISEKDEPEAIQTLSVNFPQSGQAFVIRIKFVIDDTWNKYALQKVPAGTNVISRLSTQTTDTTPNTITKEPFYILNNIPNSNLAKVSGSSLDLSRAAGKLDKLYYSELNLAKKDDAANKLSLNLVKSQTYPLKDMKLPYAEIISSNATLDVIGNALTDIEKADVNEDEVANKCQGKDYCNKDILDAEKEIVKGELIDGDGSLAESITVQRLDYAGFGEYAARRFADALARTLADYAADKAQYKACGGAKGWMDICTGKISGTSNYECYAGDTHCDNSISGGEFWAMTQEQFARAACDSEVANNYEAIFATGNYDLLKTLIMRKLLGDSLYSPRISYTRPIVDLDGLDVDVLYKAAAQGESAGFVLERYKIGDALSTGGAGGLISLSDWVGGKKVSDATPTTVTGPDSQGASGSGKFAPIRFEDKKAPQYFYLIKDGDKTTVAVDDPGKPNLFTMNKYPLDLTDDKLKIFTEGEKPLKELIIEDKEDKKAIKVTSCWIELKKQSESEIIFVDNKEYENGCAKFGIDLKAIQGAINKQKINKATSWIQLSPDSRKLSIIVASNVQSCDPIKSGSLDSTRILGATEGELCIESPYGDEVMKTSLEIIKAQMRFLLDESAPSEITIEGKKIPVTVEQTENVQSFAKGGAESDAASEGTDATIQFPQTAMSLADMDYSTPFGPPTPEVYGPPTPDYITNPPVTQTTFSAKELIPSIVVSGVKTNTDKCANTDQITIVNGVAQYQYDPAVHKYICVNIIGLDKAKIGAWSKKPFLEAQLFVGVSETNAGGHAPTSIKADGTAQAYLPISEVKDRTIYAKLISGTNVQGRFWSLKGSPMFVKPTPPITSNQPTYDGSVADDLSILRGP
ncbi:MAG: carboxypeptidase regulatory-like domain-containing protein [Candidatus Micrarchaeota archaeon]